MKREQSHGNVVGIGDKSSLHVFDESVEDFGHGGGVAVFSGILAGPLAVPKRKGV